MDLLVAGTPGPLLRWTCDLIAGVAARADRTLAYETASPDESWMPPPASEAMSARLFVTTEPGQAAVAAVRDGKLPAILVVDDPRRSLLDIVGAGHQRDVAFRSVSASATLLGEMRAGPAVVVVSADAGEAIRRRLLGWVNDRFRLPNAPDLAALAHDFPGALSTDAALTSDEAAVVAGALSPACRYAATGKRQSVIWPRACLFWGDRPGEPAPRVLDLTGPSRVLAYGPYFHLPPGRWTARAMVAFSPECRGAPFSFELHGSAEFGRCNFGVDHPGVFIVTWKVTVPSAREALEIRLVSQRGAIEGTLGIDHVEFVPDPD